ncbi:MAG: hypothetical protein KDK71_01175 [Chlamydiia bacterium]|nr:hypothetical protein [Chlamydiia bacterium]
MRRAIFPLFTFLVLTVGLVYYYPQLHFHKKAEKRLMHDKPVACQLCGALMWDGLEVHDCAR